MQLEPDVEVIFEFVGFRKDNVFEGYRPAHLVCKDCLTTGIHSYYNLNEADKKLRGTITFISPEHYPQSLWVGKEIPMYEGRNIVGYATVIKIVNPVLCKNIEEN